MAITRSRLFKISDRSAIQAIVAEQVHVIDLAIQTADSAGMCSITHELPSVFRLANFDKSDAQLMIYSELVDLYRRSEDDGGRGFEIVEITIAPRSFLHIGWVNGMDERERAARRKIILDSRRPTETRGKPSDAKPRVRDRRRDAS